MRIVRYLAADGPTLGVLEDRLVRPIPAATTLVEAVARVGDVETAEPQPLEGLRRTAPVAPLVRNLFCVGWNYLAHFAEGVGKGNRPVDGDDEIPKRPAFFTKATGALIGPDDPIEAHASITQTLDWEVELAVVVGVGGRDIAEDAAMDHVLGYTVANDVSARNVQRGHGGQWFRGKSLDRTCPIGPWLVTPDEMGELGPRAIRCRVNGELMQDARLGDMHFAVPRIIAELSSGLTLLPGDVILTGTPPGVGFARNPPRYLQPGDLVEAEIEGIGALRNRVGPA